MILRTGLMRQKTPGIGNAAFNRSVFKCFNIIDGVCTAVPQVGTGNLSMTRATTAQVLDFEGIWRTAKAGELRFQGARRVENLITTSSASLAVGATNTMTLAAGTYVFSMGAGSGTATFSGTGGATGTLTANSTKRVSATLTITAGTLIVTASVATLVDLQVSDVTLTTLKTPSEYVSKGVLTTPYYHGCFVDGVKYFAYANGNTVDGSGVVTEARGVTFANAPEMLLEAASTNLYLNSANLATQNITTTAQSYTVSFYGTGSIAFSGSYTGSLVGTGANTRVSLTFTATAGTLTSTVTGSCIQAQAQAGLLSSYIPTAGTAVVKNTDTLTIPTASNIAADQGWGYLEVVMNAVPSLSYSLFCFIDVSNSTTVVISPTVITFGRRVAGTSYNTSIGVTVTEGVRYKIAFTYGVGGSYISVNGAISALQANELPLQLAATSQLGTAATTERMRISKMQFGSTRVSPSTIVAMTR